MTPPTHNKTVLLIDDDKNLLYALRRYLRLNHYRCFIAESALQGLKIAQRIRPHLIILDLNMPAVSGLSFLNTRKTDPIIAQTPIVVLSGENDESVVRVALDWGAKGYFVKGSSHQHLLELIREYAIDDRAREVL